MLQNNNNNIITCNKHNRTKKSYYEGLGGGEKAPLTNGYQLMKPSGNINK